MSVVSRRLPSVPARTSTATWNAIIDLVTPPDASARAELVEITNTAAMVIAEEYTSEAPIVFMPATGDRVRVYTVHGFAAIERDEPAPLATWPLAEPGWRVSLPCGTVDLDEVRAALQSYPQFDVRDLTEGITAASTPVDPRTSRRIKINYAELEQA